jgi:5-methylcytosine-specific restriction endonuclease McrA
VAKATRFWHRKARWQRVTRLMARDGDSCAICGTTLYRAVRDANAPNYITFDHVVPRSAGGGDLLENLRLAHRSCNEQRGCDPLLPEQEAA